MNLAFSFPYKELSGLIKIRLESPGTTPFRRFWMAVNGVESPLAIAPDYLLSAGDVEFGVNTHRIGSTSAEFIVRGECVSGEMIYTNAIRCRINNDKSIHEFLEPDLDSFPKLFGLPIDSSNFRSRSGRYIYPSPYLRPAQSGAAAPWSAYFKEYDEKGWLVVDGLLAEDLIDAAARELDAACAAGYAGYQEGESKRLEHLHLREGAIKSVFNDPRIREFLGRLYGVEMVPCQTLSYRYGSQQAVHSDFVHLTAFPENLMCGVWIALEDVRAGSGELLVYSGTHKLPRLTTQDIGGIKVANADYGALGKAMQDKWEGFLASGGFEPTPMHVRKGSLIVWDGNLLHAGSARRDPSLTRKSIVLHYFGRGAYSYFDALGDIGVSAELV